MKLFKRKGLLLLIAIVLILQGCSLGEVNNNSIDVSDNIEEQVIEVNEENALEEEKNISTIKGNIEVHFIDVGQGDSILVKQGEESMLIDAGDNGYGDIVVDYLKGQGISKLDYLIATHPHADHIGGMDLVVKEFDIGKVIMPNKAHTTKTFERLLLEIQEKGLKITNPKVGDVLNIGDSSFTILSPGKDYNNLNNHSVVGRLEYSNNSFMLTGDAEMEAELDMLRTDLTINSDILKVGHHGSNTSAIKKFLDEVNPKAVIIQVGQGNKYNHPDDRLIERLKERNIEIFRNDIDGNIVVIGDGEKLEIKTNEESVSVEESNIIDIVEKEKIVEERVEKVEEIEEIQDKSNNYEGYIGNINSKIFHKSDCSSLPKESNREYLNSKELALELGYRACQRCNP